MHKIIISNAEFRKNIEQDSQLAGEILEGVVLGGQGAFLEYLGWLR